MKRTTKTKSIDSGITKLIRRTPKQARGQLRVDEILDAAERLIRTSSWEKISTNHIAREAGIPIGSLYQFFANKHAIAHALVERYIVSIEQAFTSLPEHLETLTPAELVNTIFDRLLMVSQKQGGLHAMLMTADENSEIGKASAPIAELLRSNIERVLAARAPWMKPKERKLHALVSQVTNKALFAQALRLMSSDETGAKQLLQQARLMQIAYYDHILQEHDVAK
jgi:AcrR family transcriptional regulator